MSPSRLLSAFLVSAAACTTDATAPAEQLLEPGTYDLVAQNGVPLPITEFEILTPDGHGTGCFYQLTTGSFHLTPQGGFEFAYDYTTSCGGGVLAHIAVAGVIEFQPPDRFSGAVGTLPFSGQVFKDHVDVRFGGETFTLRFRAP